MLGPESNIQVIETYVVMKALPPSGEIPVFDVDGKMISSGVNIGSLGGSQMHFSGSLIGEANSTFGMFCKAAENVYSNPTGRPLSSPYAPGGGFQNGDVSPHRMPKAGNITKLGITFEGAAVGTGVKDPAISVRFRIYRMGGASRVQIAEVDIPLSDLANVGIWNNASANAFQAIEATLSVSVSAGDLIGWEFVPVSANNFLNVLRVVESTLTVS
jgi:hypothetical protein